jgi:hypothetical protein
MQSRRAYVRLGLVCLGLAVAGLAAFNSAQRSIPADHQAPGTAALRAAIDPETGELVIGAGATGLAGDEKAAAVGLEKMLSRSAEGLEEVRHPDGSVSVHLDGRFMNASVARIGADGKVETLCAESLDEAQEFLDATPSTKTAPETDANGWEVR